MGKCFQNCSILINFIAFLRRQFGLLISFAKSGENFLIVEDDERKKIF